MKYKDWLTQWLENYVYPSVKVRTFERYKLIVERHIKEKLGGTELSELSLLALQSFITELLRDGNKKTGGGLAANSVNSVISVIQSSLKTAHLLGLTKEYIADKLKRPKLTEKPVECFSLAEQKRIEQAIMSRSLFLNTVNFRSIFCKTAQFFQLKRLLQSFSTTYF